MLPHYCATQGRRDLFDVRRALSRAHRPRPRPRAGQRPEDRLRPAARPPPGGARRFSRPAGRAARLSGGPAAARSSVPRARQASRACRTCRSPISSARRRRAASGRRSSGCRTSSPTSSTRRAPRSPIATAREFTPSERLAEPRTIVAVWALAAESDAEAERLSASHRMAMRLFLSGTLIRVPPVETALKFLAEQPGERAAAQSPAPSHRRLAREECGATSRRWRQEYGAEEVMVVTITHEHAARRRSYELDRGGVRAG